MSKGARFIEAPFDIVIAKLNSLLLSIGEAAFLYLIEDCVDKYCILALFRFMKKVIHIVSFAVPWPPDYGGAMDVYYKIRALHREGVEIILHCFRYGDRKASEMLNEFCREVYYYERQTGFSRQLSLTPYIVNSRINKNLVERLCKDDYPILLEGVHTCAVLKDKRLKGRNIWVRLHNVEHRYYRSLAKLESSVLKRLYYSIEAYRLFRFEKSLPDVSGLIPISPNDNEFFRNYYSTCSLITAFSGFDEVFGKEGTGQYLLYHGDLSIAENIIAALFLMDICQQMDTKLILAGREPDRELIKACEGREQVEIKANVNHSTMENLIQNATAVLLPAQQTTGLRLKLLVSLFEGRHCIVSPEMVQNTGLSSLCYVAKNREEWMSSINTCLNRPYTSNDINVRRVKLKQFMDGPNARKLIDLIWFDQVTKKQQLGHFPF